MEAGGLDSQQPRQFSAKLIFKALRGLPRIVNFDNYFGYQLQKEIEKVIAALK